MYVCIYICMYVYMPGQQGNWAQCNAISLYWLDWPCTVHVPAILTCWPDYGLGIHKACTTNGIQIIATYTLIT